MNWVLLIAKYCKTFHVKHEVSETFDCQTSIKHRSKIKNLHEKLRILDDVNRKSFDYLEHLTMTVESLLISIKLFDVWMVENMKISLLKKERVKLVHYLDEPFPVDM